MYNNANVKVSTQPKESKHDYGQLQHCIKRHRTNFFYSTGDEAVLHKDEKIAHLQKSHEDIEKNLQDKVREKDKGAFVFLT